MRRTALACFVWIALLSSAGQAAAEPLDATKQRDIEEILRVLEWNPGPDALPLVVASLRRAYPRVHDADWQDVQRAADGVADPRERMIALYDRLFTADEVHQLLAHYRSPLGRKLLAVGGETVAERMVGRNEYVMEVSHVMESMLRARGYERAPVVPLAAPAPEALTPASDGRPFRPRVVQPNE